MEMWDLYDSERQPIFRLHQRGKKIKPGEYHIVVEVWTVNSEKNILVTLRDSSKEMYPDKWENTGGSALSGETSKQAAVRELMEETGIIAAQEELTLLGTCREEDAFHDIYILHRDIPVTHLTMQAGETTDAKWIILDQLDAMVADQTLALSVGRRLSYIRKKFQEYLDNL